MPGSCPSTEQLRRVLREELQGEEQAAVQTHLDFCAACQKTLEQLAGGTDWLPQAARSAGGATPAESLKPKPKETMDQFRPGPPAPGRIKAAPTETAVPGFLQPADGPGLLGRLGAYEVIEEIARGGMGIVFKARDLALHRIVAIKVLAPALATNAVARARFVREARAAAAISHENVITIHAVEETREVPYLVMQFIAGKTLARRIQDGPLPLVEILRIGFQMASGLAAAHRLGLIHRDIKPANILLENSVERVKITDFGLARAGEESALTLPGYIAGTPQYMSPEQARGEPVDQRADLFSVGCVLYEMATGLSPFRAPAPLVSLRKVCDEDPAPAQVVNPAMPVALGRLIQRLLVKSPAQRLQTAQELADKLGRFLAQWEQAARAANHRGTRDQGGTQLFTKSKHARVARWAAMSTGLLVLALATVWIATRTRRPARVVSSIAAPSAEAVTPEPDLPTNRFVLLGTTGALSQGFDSLPDALKAAGSNAVIACRWNGTLESQPINLGQQALTLRAAPGFRPTLAASGPGSLVSTKAMLVLEGLEFVIGQTQRRDERRAPTGLGPGTAMVAGASIVECVGAPFFATHCRFVKQLGGDRTHCLQLRDPQRCELRDCEFYASAGGSAIGVIVERHAGDSIRPVGVTLRNCVVYSPRGLQLGFMGKPPGWLVLERNTFAGDYAMDWLQYPTKRFSVSARSNVFDVKALMGRRRALGNWNDLASNYVAWRESRNLFSVQTFSILRQDGSSADPKMDTLESWNRYWNLPDSASQQGKLRVREHLDAQQALSAKISPDDFRIAEASWVGTATNAAFAPGEVGAETGRVGPGAAYEAWRASAEYPQWLGLIRQPGFAP